MRELAVSISLGSTGRGLHPLRRFNSLTHYTQLSVYPEENSFVPVAWYRTAKRSQVVGGDIVEPPSLSLQPTVESVQDHVLSSLLIIEQKYRMGDKRIVLADRIRNTYAAGNQGIA